LLNGIQTYDPCFRGLGAYYPPDPLRRLIRLPSPFSGSDSNEPINLVDYQERDVRRKGLEAAVQSRAAILDAWKKSLERQTGPGDQASARPILVVVSTSGGALRAGVWTAAVLDAIGTELPEFPRHVRYVTGASGGMVGAALFVTSSLSPRAAGALSAAAPALGGLADRLSNDYLSPIARQYILRDLPFAIFPWRQSYDRGHALEDAMVVQGQLTELGYTFSRLLDAERQGQIPSLVFSPMLVEDGRRLLISNLDLDDLTTIDGADLLCESHDEIVKLIENQTLTRLKPRDGLEFRRINAISAVEFFRLFPQARDSFKVITAVRMNATFPVVTPTGILPTDSPRQVVDAGYYDNYGVDLATALIFAHRDWLASNTGGVLLVQIRAFRNEKQLKVLDQPVLSEGLVNTASKVTNILARGIRWLTSPVTGVAEARESVMHYRNDFQTDVLGHFFRDRVKTDPDFFKTVVFTCDTEIKSTDEQQVETLNWHLSDEEMTEIKNNMASRDQNQIRLKKLIAWWRQRGN
jgi:Patatin-like phospholipase